MVTTALNDEPMQGKQNLASEVLCVQESPATSQPTTSTVSAHDFHEFLKHTDHENISRFCDLASGTTDGANLKLFWTHTIEEGRKLGIEEGKEVGYGKGYGEGYGSRRLDMLQDEFTFEQFRSEGFGEGLSIGFKNRELAGREAERASRDHRTANHTHSSTQTTTTVNTADSSTQTTSTIKTATTIEMATQTTAVTATSPVPMTAQMPSTLTTTTPTSSPVSKRPPAAQK
jgi:hypothetical protein